MKYPGQPLFRGVKGDAVRAVQLKLGVHQTGVFGPTTEECVTAFQRGHGLEPDGVVGPLTWATLFGAEAPHDFGLAALAEAKVRVGVREQPLGSNRGPEVDAYNEEAGVAKGSFWCMSFVHYCCRKAAKKLNQACPIPRTASCSALYLWAKRNGRLVARPEPGDIFLCIGGETGHFHTGFVAGPVENGRFPTIEGNSNAGGSANGIGVVKRPTGRLLQSCHYVRL